MIDDLGILPKEDKPKKKKNPFQEQADEIEKNITDNAKALNVSIYKILSGAITLSVFALKLGFGWLDWLLLLAISLSPEFVSYMKIVLTGKVEDSETKVKLLEKENEWLSEKADWQSRLKEEQERATKTREIAEYELKALVRKAVLLSKEWNDSNASLLKEIENEKNGD